jgi:hypothetical protein
MGMQLPRPRKPGKPATGLPVPLEKDIQRAILSLLSFRGIMAWRVNSGAMSAQSSTGKKRFMRFNGMPGMSDIAGILPGGQSLFVEVKRPGEKPTDLQANFLALATAQGALAFWADSLAMVERTLKEAGY